MNFLKKFYDSNLKYELINRFIYKNTKKMPRIEKIVLNFGCKTADSGQLASSLLALEFLTDQVGVLTKSKYSNISFKIRKGNPTGCKATLTKLQVFKFLSKLIVEIFPKLRGIKTFYRKRITLYDNSFSLILNEPFIFNELEQRYYLFTSLQKLNITVTTNSQTKTELLCILNSLKFPLR